MPDEIPPLPPIPESLRIAATQGALIPFVGAGLSKLGGCPDWKEFAARSLSFFVERGKIDYLYLEQLSHLGPRVKLSLARNLEAEHSERIDYAALLKPTGAAAIARGQRAYDGLSRLAQVFVTTNYDDWLDTAPSPQSQSGGTGATPAMIRRNVFYRVEDLTINKLDTPNTVMHIHGSMNDPTSMIVTTSDYLARYANHAQIKGAFKENKYLAFLEALFRVKSVLFIGYGLEELEILEYVVQKARDANAATATVDGREFFVYEFVDELTRLVPQNPQAVANALQTLVSARPPSYDYKGAIKNLLLVLAESGQRPVSIRLADQLRTLGGMPETFEELSRTPLTN